jgi:hypothetical protein
MKLPAFDYTKQRWDEWSAYHVTHTHPSLVQFDTDEFVICSRRWTPYDRCRYPDLHLQIVGTHDDDCPRLYVPGSDKPVPKSHLNHKGMQVLLLDLDHHRAVGVYPVLTQDSAPAVPARFFKPSSARYPGYRHDISVYYPGPDAMPVGAPITQAYPQPLTMSQRTHVRELVDACKVWRQMQPESEFASRAPWKFQQLLAIDFADLPFATLTTEQRTAIALHGFNMIMKEEHAYLQFTG